MNWKLVDLTVHGDERGNLVAIEKGSGIDFDIKRVFYMYSLDNKYNRGEHANKNSKFLLVALSGSLKVFLDDGNKQETIELSSPDRGIYINNMVWKRMCDFSNDCVVMVLASEVYDKNEYEFEIRK